MALNTRTMTATPNVAENRIHPSPRSFMFPSFDGSRIRLGLTGVLRALSTRLLAHVFSKILAFDRIAR